MEVDEDHAVDTPFRPPAPVGLQLGGAVLGQLQRQRGRRVLARRVLDTRHQLREQRRHAEHVRGPVDDQPERAVER
ncbi:hypothetical protein [Actinophytocola oryzae]|uniref:hypothetical protein n=1 Tax=Actinophytocola oryzae TaxID=502181 RepID=UPI0014151CD1|nr:hypothetical protein [Actinophytocola oryzae]